MATFYSIALPVLITFHVVVCLLMVFLVLMQRPRSEGLGAAFGGGMTDSLFGAQTTNVLAKFTVWLGVSFFALTLLLAVVYAKSSSIKTSTLSKELLAQPTPVTAPAAPAAAATPAVSPEVAPSPEAAASPETQSAPVSPTAPEAPAAAESPTSVDSPAAAVESPAATSPAASEPVSTPAASPAP